MKSLRELLILGPGPSSSHTIGPFRIATAFRKENEGRSVVRFEVTLYGSLAYTGRGHFTEDILKKAFAGYPCEVFFNTEEKNLKHPNTMKCTACLSDGTTVSKRYLSIGGGAFQEEDGIYSPKDIYPFHSFDEMKQYIQEHGNPDLYDLIVSFEGEEILTYGEGLLTHSFETIEKSLLWKGTLPGPLKLTAVSGDIYQKAQSTSEEADRRTLLLSAFAYATAEANARGEMVVTNPTCGSAGVVPSCLYYEKTVNHRSLSELTKAYLVGALVCDFIKENASLSGALLGCQAEIGSASSFAAASLSYLNGLPLHGIEYAAEVAMEHFLGLTCDPVDGYVQIPCIERNGMASIHAYSAYLYAKDISPFRHNKVTFDNVVKAMNETGRELPSDLKETSLGGLAKVVS
jgi:L-serine dehydratase